MGFPPFLLRISLIAALSPGVLAGHPPWMAALREPVPLQAEPKQETEPEAPLATEDERLGSSIRLALASVPRRTKIGRMRSVRFTSDVEFPSDPTNQHTLDVSLAFPARTRMILSSEGGAVERYELGDAYFARNFLRSARDGKNRSEVLDGSGRDEVALDLALRRALFLWPDGGEFVGAGTTMTRKVGTIGVLMATLDAPGGRPVRMVAFGSNGRAAAEMRAIEWNDSGERAWPLSFEYVAGGSLIWKERVEAVDTKWLLNDAWFLPVESVAALVGQSASDRIRLRTSDPGWVESHTPSAEDDLKATYAAWIEHGAALWRERSSKPAAPTKTPGVAPALYAPEFNIVVDAALKPVAIEFEVPPGPTADLAFKSDDGWAPIAPSTQWLYLCKAIDDVVPAAFDATAVAAMARDAGRETKGRPNAGRVRCRMVEREGGWIPNVLHVAYPAASTTARPPVENPEPGESQRPLERTGG